MNDPAGPVQGRVVLFDIAQHRQAIVVRLCFRLTRLIIFMPEKEGLVFFLQEQGTTRIALHLAAGGMGERPRFDECQGIEGDFVRSGHGLAHLTRDGAYSPIQFVPRSGQSLAVFLGRWCLLLPNGLNLPSQIPARLQDHHQPFLPPSTVIEVAAQRLNFAKFTTCSTVASISWG